MLNKFSIKIIF